LARRVPARTSSWGRARAAQPRDRARELSSRAHDLKRPALGSAFVVCCPKQTALALITNDNHAFFTYIGAELNWKSF
ncbi:MAG: hypothetical protein KDC45_02815, partial [Bacteroidetes bacterium]|nr:hypothetical protein [Bacteroidota bacterium]